MPMQQSHRAQQRSGSSASNASDEDTDDHKSGSRTQSRIDKWKAKHEAMLKMASNDKKEKKNNDNAETTNAASLSEDEIATQQTQQAADGIKSNCLTKIQAAMPPAQAAVLSVK